jgi:hypothetical protein
MLDNNSTSDIFRFIQVRPPAPVDIEATPMLREGTDVARGLLGSSPLERSRLATALVIENEASIRELLGTESALDLLEAAGRLAAADGEVADLKAAAEQLSEETLNQIAAQSARISDFLLATKFARGSRPTRVLKEAASLYLVQAVVLGEVGSGADHVSMRSYLARPIALPAIPTAASEGTRQDEAASAETGQVATGRLQSQVDSLRDAIDELVLFARDGVLQEPEEVPAVDGKWSERSASGGVAFALNERGLARLSQDTRNTLAGLGIDPASVPIDAVLTELDDEVNIRASRLAAARPTVTLAAPGPEPDRPYLKTVGVADLLVVKQHLKAYQRMDIAHVENVMAKEKRSRTHRALERIEETFTTERETTRETETELETAERFEMQRETSRTIQQDQRFGFGLTLSGKYGPSVEFTSNAGADSSTSTQEATRSATTYAKDVMSRSLERVVERVREEQVVRIIREQEETNLHEFANDTDNHVIGVYQFLEKVYESQVFNYGIRQMFDFMVPEPASYLWHLESSPSTDLNLPTPPPRLAAYAATARQIHSGNYLTIAALLGVSGLAPPPPVVKTVAASINHGGAEGSEGGQPRSVVEEDLALPEGYRPIYARVRSLALTDNRLTLGITVGRAQRIWKPQQTAGHSTPVGSGHDLGFARFTLSLTGSTTYEKESKLSVQIVAFETETYGVSLEVVCRRLPEAYEQWQIKTYDALADAYQDALRVYEQRVAELRAAAEAQARNETRFGNAPSQNTLVVKDELKKHCIAIITREHLESPSSPNGMQDGPPPYFDFMPAEQRGSFTRFFEQAFEWDQMQHVFYPYYWSRYPRWEQRVNREDVDPAFLEFLQAGAARVVLPVRPGFEVAVSHYLETGEIWNGDGDPPPINSPLYFPIVEEIKERTQAPEGEIVVGDPWDTFVPTPLVILRREGNLPKWTRVNPPDWVWQEDNQGA